METCRVCLCTGPQLLSIHKSGCDQKYTFCTDLQIDPKDDLPQGICSSCYNTLDQFYFFKQMSNHSKAALLSDRLKLNGKLYERETFICNHCDKSFPRKSHLVCHLRVHVDKPYAKCDVCHKQYRSSYHLKIHSLMHSMLVNDEAPQIDKNGCVKTLLSSKSESKKFKCHLCTKSFTQNDKLSHHLDLHKKDVKLECDVCHMTFKQKRYLSKHKLRHLPSDRMKVYICHHCDKSFPHKYYLVTHLKRYEWKLNVKCNVCQEIFKCEADLAKHLKSHAVDKMRIDKTNSEKLKCQYCNVLLSRKSNLSHHLISHVQVAEFKCDVCSKMFKSQRYLKKHKLTHLPLDQRNASKCN